MCGLRVLCFACVVLCSHSVALHNDLSTTTSALESDLENSVILIPSKSECDLGATISVAYQRIDTVRDSSERLDYVGLYRAEDPTALVAYDVALVGESAQTGKVAITCKRSGNMEVRMVRSPGQILGHAAITVYNACADPSCSGHGNCVRGACVCASGWDGAGCELLSGDGLSVGWQNNPEGEFYPGDEIYIKLASSKTLDLSRGDDVINLYSVKNLRTVVQSVFVPSGELSVVMYAPSEPGAYILKYQRAVDLVEIASSQHLTVYTPCLPACKVHGQCKQGKCVCQDMYDREDCTRGPGVVTLNVTGEAYIGTPLVVEFTRDDAVGVLSDSDWIAVYKEHEETTDNPEYYAYAISDKVFDPDVKAAHPTNFSHGSVTLYMPLQSGNYIIRYVRADYAKYATSPPFTVYVPCLNRCSSRGNCTKGECVCNQGWQGSDCSLGIADFVLEMVPPPANHDLLINDVILVNFSRPAGNNTDYDFIGVYGANSANTSDQLFFYNYAVADQKTDESPEERGQVELQLLADGEMILRYVNAYTLEAEVETNSFSVFPPCVNNCSAHGVCVKGNCSCDVEWKGLDCSLGAGPIKITLTKGGPVDMTGLQMGFEVHIRRPPKMYTMGDFVALFPSAGPFDVDKNFGYTYARSQDEADVFLIVHAARANDIKVGTFLVKYFSASHEDLGTSDSFSFKFQ